MANPGKAPGLGEGFPYEGLQILTVLDSNTFSAFHPAIVEGGEIDAIDAIDTTSGIKFYTKAAMLLTIL